MTNRRRRFDYRGLAGLTLAVCGGGGFLLAMWAVSFHQDEAVSPQGAALLNTLGGVIIGIVGSWITGEMRRDDDGPEQTTDGSVGPRTITITPPRGTTTMTDHRRDPDEPDELPTPNPEPGTTPEREPEPTPEPTPEPEQDPDTAPQTPPSTEGDEADGQPLTRR